MKKTMVFLAFSLIAACAARQTPIPDPGSGAAKLFAEKCGVCHSLPHPKRHTATQWEHMMSVMDTHREHRNREPLSAGERATILGYLKKHSRLTRSEP